MPLSKSVIFEGRRGQAGLAAAAFLTLLFVSYAGLAVLHQITKAAPERNGSLLIVLFAYLIPITCSWLTHRILCLSVFVPASLVMILFSFSVTHDPSVLFLIPIELLFCYLLVNEDRRDDAVVVEAGVEREKTINKKNDLEIAYQERGTSISVYFEKYTSYYNLRNLANEFSTTLSLSALCQMVVLKTIQLLQKGDVCVLLMSEPETGGLSLMASRSVLDSQPVKMKGGDLFDFWVLRNRQSLLIHDSQKDFRFDLKKVEDLGQVASVISSPLIYEGKPIGVLRIHAQRASQFSTDDLRILDAISTLASSALSNALLFQRTEELAIRDSLTGLYVHRHFLERLKEEHRRSLLTSGPISLLMCDLDQFKACNDQYGHGVGDLILKEAGQVLRETAKDGIVARYGGEEFSVLLPKIERSGAVQTAQSICNTLRNRKIVVRRESIPVTISIGVASFPIDTLDSEELIRIADRRLYEAKRQGRDRICSEG